MTKLLPYRINWTDPFEEAYAYKTEVITSRDKTEQRIAWRSQPRLSVSYKASPVRQEVRGMWNRLRFDMGERAVVPKATAPMRLAAPASGDTLPIVGALPVWAAAGKYLVVSRKTGLELLQVLAVSGSTITLEVPLSAPLLEGSPIYQGLTGALDQTMKATLLTTHASNLSVDFMADPGDNVYFADDDPEFPDMHGGFPILLLKPNWAQGVTLNAIGFLETTDFDFGRIEHNVDSFIGYSDVSVRAGYSLMSGEAAEKMKTLFHKLKGQQKPFLVPSWAEGALGAVTAGGNSLRAAGTDLHDTLTASEGFYYGAVAFYRDGTAQVHKIGSSFVSTGPDGGLESKVNFTGSFSQGSAAVYLLHKARFVVDTLTLSFQTATVATTQLTYKPMKEAME